MNVIKFRTSLERFLLLPYCIYNYLHELFINIEGSVFFVVNLSTGEELNIEGKHVAHELTYSCG